MATQTPLLITLQALTASQMDRTEELKASAKRSRTLTTTTISDIPTLFLSSVQTLSLTLITVTQATQLTILAATKRF